MVRELVAMSWFVLAVQGVQGVCGSLTRITALYSMVQLSLT